MPSLLGIDNGLTVSKAVLFDVDGRQIAVARRRVPQLMPQARFVERDMTTLWSATAEAIADVIAQSGRPASDIACIAATAHGDGLYLLDGDRQPLGPGILSLDSRAGDIVDAWSSDGFFEQALAVTGQVPHSSAPSALLVWIARNDPDRFSRIAHVFGAKDWLRFCLTGTIGTDRTEASTAFTDPHTQTYSADALALFGLSGLRNALPEIGDPASLAGTVTPEAAKRTGLVEGTPVAFGLHDVTASALGIGGQREGAVDIVAGTYSINQVVSDVPRSDPRWFCRNAIKDGQWNNMSISPASAANYDWFLDTLCQTDKASDGDAIHATVAAEINAALARDSTVLFHPFLFGSPHGNGASGSFLGLHGWHDRGDMLRAILEGIAFNHRTHVDALREGFSFTQARLTGGASRNPAFAQMMADVLNLPVTVTETEEAAAWAAALCAGTAVGLYDSVYDDPRGATLGTQDYFPVEETAARYDTRFAVWNRAVSALKPLWPDIENLGDIH